VLHLFWPVLALRRVFLRARKPSTGLPPGWHIDGPDETFPAAYNMTRNPSRIKSYGHLKSNDAFGVLVVKSARRQTVIPLRA